MFYYFSHARTALIYGLQHFGIKSNDYILLPEYICDVVLHPLDQLGIKYKYYPINNDLTPNWMKLEKVINEKTKTLLMVHYFGQPQDIEKFQNFCKKHNLLLVEDNAHGHGGRYDGKLLGTFGNIGISSPRKILNISSGGLLWLKDKKLNIQADLSPYSVSLGNHIKRSIFDSSPSLINSIKKGFKNRPRYENPKAFRETPIPDYAIDRWSKKTIEKTDWNELSKNRLAAYKEWQSFALGNSLTPVYLKLHPESNPWCFPAYVKDQRDAIKWFDWGWQNNKHVFSWPSLPGDMLTKNSESFTRWKKLICFGIS